jgi:hypothetical protein
MPIKLVYEQSVEADKLTHSMSSLESIQISFDFLIPNFQFSLVSLKITRVEVDDFDLVGTINHNIPTCNISMSDATGVNLDQQRFDKCFSLSHRHMAPRTNHKETQTRERIHTVSGQWCFARIPVSCMLPVHNETSR